MFVPPLDMRVSFPRIDIHPTLPRLRIDARDAYGDIGLKPMGRLAKESAGASREAGDRAVADIAREGDRLARVEESTDAIAEIAAEKWPALRELNVDYAPKHRPQVFVEPGQVSMRFSPGDVQIQVPVMLGRGRVVDVRA